jgi:uncharacterized membrane protein YjgN (DUF898 family)
MSSSEATGAVASVQSAAVTAANGGRFFGGDRDFWRLLVRGAVLLMLTLGIYRFWLVTDIRRFLWTNSEIAGDGLEYTGTARELLLGFLVAIALLVPLYLAFFVAALDLGVLGKLASVLGLLLLALLGQFALYRARRYRLTRTIFRGLRFHQSGSAWHYAVCALFWWAMIAVTLGLAYPWAQANLERYKMRNTYYGDLAGHFAASGMSLFFRGFLLWLIVVGPMILGFIIALGAIDWGAIIQVLRRGGDDMMGQIEGASPGFASAILSAISAIGWAVAAAAILYPAFQAIMLRWWISGIRFGQITPSSKLRMTSVYAVYLRFFWYALVFSVVVGVAAAVVLAAIGLASSRFGEAPSIEIVTTVAAVTGYVVVMLGFSTIYQATVKLRLWRLAFETLELSGLAVLERVKARGEASSALGEGLADALNVGGV